MSSRDVSERLNESYAKGKGCNLNIDQVRELVDSIGSMARVIQAMCRQDVVVGVPPDALADTIASCLCLTDGGRLTIHHTGGGTWVLSDADMGLSWEGETLLAAIDELRSSLDLDPVSGVQIHISGEALYSQLAALVEQPDSLIV